MTVPQGLAAAVAGSVPLAVLTRGDHVESVHHGSIAVVDLDGRILFSAGDPRHLTFTRSTLKPFQALPFVRAGGIERFKLTAPETALLCASHSGEPRHAQAAGAILAKAGNTAADLKCGTHAPGFYEVRGEVPPQPPYSPLVHNCSGKHAGMLAHCVACGYEKGAYLEVGHPLQGEVRHAVASVTDVAEDAMPQGTDGCSLPNYAVPLDRLALAYARLSARAPEGDYAGALATLAEAMTAHPEMVSGEGRSDLVLAQAGAGDWVCKIGAEAVQCVGIRSKGVAVAIKLDDGARRALLPVTIAALDQAGLLDDGARAALAPHATPTQRNLRGVPTGQIRPVFVLDNDSRAAPGGGALRA